MSKRKVHPASIEKLIFTHILGGESAQRRHRRHAKRLDARKVVMTRRVHRIQICNRPA